MRAILIANGVIENTAWLAQYLQPEDMIICADGGYNYLAEIGRMPDIIIGDMDSVRQGDTPPCAQLIHPTHKDETDAQLALDYAIEKGYRDIRFLGALGGKRVEHAVANLFLLQYAAERGAQMKIETEFSSVLLCQGQGTYHFCGKTGDYLSLIPIGGDATGITTHHLEYPLQNGCLRFGVPMGISNVLLADQCSITLTEGKLLAILTNADEVDKE